MSCGRLEITITNIQPSAKLENSAKWTGVGRAHLEVLEIERPSKAPSISPNPPKWAKSAHRFAEIARILWITPGTRPSSRVGIVVKARIRSRPTPAPAPSPGASRNRATQNLVPGTVAALPAMKVRPNIEQHKELVDSADLASIIRSWGEQINRKRSMVDPRSFGNRPRLALGRFRNRSGERTRVDLGSRVGVHPGSGKR